MGAPNSLLEPLQGRAAGEGEVEVEARDQVGRQILVLAAAELGQRDRRVDVVEGLDAAGGGADPVADRHALRHVGADDHRVGVGDQRRVRRARSSSRPS